MLPKADFSKEILRKDSRLRILLGNNCAQLNTSQVPAIRRDENGIVTIDFHLLSEIKLSEDPRELLKCLKQRYGEKIEGKLFYRALYTTFEQVFYFHIDLADDLC